MEVLIRKAKIEDAPFIRELMYELTEKSSEEKAFNEMLLRILENDDYYISCAEIEGKVAGMMMGIICLDIYDDLRPFMVIENVIITEKYRGLNIGKKLIEDVENWGKEKNISYCNIVSSDFRKGAHAFYERCGYAREAGFRKTF